MYNFPSLCLALDVLSASIAGEGKGVQLPWKWTAMKPWKPEIDSEVISQGHAQPIARETHSST